MSVSASIVCVSCDMYGPPIGDGGHVGYPSLADQEDCHGDLASFEYVFKGCAAIGYRPRELEAIRAFLIAHRRHRVGLFREGEEYSSRFPPLTTAPSKKFEFSDDDDFVNALFELACDRCAAVFRTERAIWLRPLKPHKVSRGNLQKFSSRVLDVDALNFHRVFGLLDPSSPETRRLRDFLREHGNHGVNARTVGDEEWSVLAAPSAPPTGPVLNERCELFWTAGNVMPHPAAVAPPLRLLWSYEKAQAVREAPLVVDGSVYTSTTDGEALACLSPDGSERWRLDLGARHAFTGGRCLAAVGSRLILTLYAKRKEERELLVINCQTGEIEQRVPFAFWQVSVVPGEDRIVGSRFEYGATHEGGLALFELSSLERPVWEHAHSPDHTLRSFQRFTIDGGRVYTLWDATLVAMGLSDGEIAWRRPLSEFGDRIAVYPSPLSVSNGTLLLDTPSGLIAFDSGGGEIKWRREQMEWRPRVVCGGTLYAVEQNDRLDIVAGSVIALEVATGREIQRVDVASDAFARTPPPRPSLVGFPAVALSHLFVGDRDGRIWALNRETLSPEWMTRPGQMVGPPGALPVAYRNRLLVKSYDGRLYCFDGPAT